MNATAGVRPDACPWCAARIRESDYRRYVSDRWYQATTYRCVEDAAHVFEVVELWEPPT